MSVMCGIDLLMPDDEMRTQPRWGWFGARAPSQGSPRRARATLGFVIESLWDTNLQCPVPSAPSHNSIPGNPLLAESLYLTKYIERMGAGTRDMIRLCTAAGLPEPVFHLADGFVTTIRRKAADPVNDPVTDPVTDPVNKLVLLLGEEAQVPNVLQKRLLLKHRPTFRQNYLHAALEAELIERTLPDKPNSRLQKYQLTPKGRALLEGIKKEVKKP